MELDLNEELNAMLYEILAEALVSGVDANTISAIHEALEIPVENGILLNDRNYVLLSGLYKVDALALLTYKDRLILDTMMDKKLIQCISEYAEETRDKMIEIIEDPVAFENYITHHEDLLRKSVDVGKLSDVNESCDYPLHPTVDLSDYHIDTL